MIVLVSSGCRNRIPHTFISLSSGEEGSPRSGCWLIWSHMRACFLNHRWLSSLSYGREKERERERGGGELFWSLLIRSLISWRKLHPHDLMTSQRLISKYHGGVEPLQHMNFWRTHSVHGNNEYRKPFNKRCVCFLSHQNYLSCIFLDSNMLLNTLNVIEMNLFSVDHMPWFPQYIWVSAYYPGGVINNTSFYCQICSSLGNKLYDQHLYYQYFKDIFVP